MPLGAGISSGSSLAAGSVTTTEILDGTVALADMADLATDKLIGRFTAGTGVPEAVTCTDAAQSILDDATVSAILDTLGGASATGSGGVVRATSPTLVTPLLGTPTSGTLTNCTGMLGVVKISTLTGSGTFTPQATTNRLIVIGVGPGGGGAGADQEAAAQGVGGGGGSGACAVVYVTAAMEAGNYAYVCGTGGAGGAAGPNNGSNGSASSTFTGNTTGNVITCPAGNGGTQVTGTTAAGRFAVGGTGGAAATQNLGTAILLTTGEQGAPGMEMTQRVGGCGGSSILGRGGDAGSEADGSAGGGYGAGGGGTAVAAAGTDRAGGAGSNGAFVVIELRS